MYPNPTADILYFTQTTNVSIYDMLGRKLLSLENSKKIDVSGLAIGMYILKLENGKTTKFTKR